MPRAKNKTRLSKEIQDEIKLYVANDWDIKEQTPEYVVLHRNTASFTGHIIVFLFFGWWSLGMANLLYHFMNSKTKKLII